jgi:hypothetical protein
MNPYIPDEKAPAAAQTKAALDSAGTAPRSAARKAEGRQYKRETGIAVTGETTPDKNISKPAAVHNTQSLRQSENIGLVIRFQRGEPRPSPFVFLV